MYAYDGLAQGLRPTAALGLVPGVPCSLRFRATGASQKGSRDPPGFHCHA